jgi:hypothetical protein
VGGGYVVSVVDATLLLLETADLRRRRISTREEGIKLIMTKDVSRWLVEVTHLSWDHLALGSTRRGVGDESGLKANEEEGSNQEWIQGIETREQWI